MSQFKRFNTSENNNWNSSAAYPEGTLTWDPDNGLRIHDGSNSGGNPIGVTNYYDLTNRPTGTTAILDLIGGGSTDNNGKFMKQFSLDNQDWASVTFADLNITDGTAGQVLTTDGAGAYSFTTPSSGGVTSYNDLTDKPTIPSLGALTVSVNTIQGSAAGQVGTIFTKSADFNATNYSTGGGTLPFINFGPDSDIDSIRAGWTVTFASGETRTVATDPYKPIGTYWNISFNNSYTWSAGDVMPITFSSPDYVAGSDPVVVLSADNNNWTFDNAGKLTLPAGGDIVDSTGTSVLGGASGGSGAYVIKDANFTAEAGKTYWLNSGNSPKTMTLPASPAAGDWVKVYDGSMNWPTYSLTVNGNGNNIKIYNIGGGTWGTAASTTTYNQSLISPAGPFPIALIWDGTDWYGAI